MKIVQEKNNTGASVLLSLTPKECSLLSKYMPLSTECFIGDQRLEIAVAQELPNE